MFSLHPQLEKDSLYLGDLALCQVRLMDNRLYPWLILVPQVPNLAEIHELLEESQNILMREVANASWVMQTMFKADKMNVAALGNQVPQLHVHVIARYKGDAAWPNPVWGAKPTEPYETKEALSLVSRYREALKLAQR